MFIVPVASSSPAKTLKSVVLPLPLRPARPKIHHFLFQDLHLSSSFHLSHEVLFYIYIYHLEIPEKIFFSVYH